MEFLVFDVNSMVEIWEMQCILNGRGWGPTAILHRIILVVEEKARNARKDMKKTWFMGREGHVRPTILRHVFCNGRFPLCLSKKKTNKNRKSTAENGVLSFRLQILEAGDPWGGLAIRRHPA